MWVSFGSTSLLSGIVSHWSESIFSTGVGDPRSMDSDEENDMVKRFRESDIGLKGDKGPKYDGKQASWMTSKPARVYIIRFETCLV